MYFFIEIIHIINMYCFYSRGRHFPSRFTSLFNCVCVTLHTHIYKFLYTYDTHTFCLHKVLRYDLFYIWFLLYKKNITFRLQS